MTAGRPEPFDEAERAAVYRVIAERRDMRHFSGGAVDPTVLPGEKAKCSHTVLWVLMEVRDGLVGVQGGARFRRKVTFVRFAQTQDFDPPRSQGPTEVNVGWREVGGNEDEIHGRTAV